MGTGGRRCGKCDGANVPLHDRLCPLRGVDDDPTAPERIPVVKRVGDPGETQFIEWSGDESAGPAG